VRFQEKIEIETKSKLNNNNNNNKTAIFICRKWLETRRASAHQSWFQKEIEN